MIAGSATLSNCDGPQADAAHLELWVAHASKRTHLNDAVQGVTAKVIVGPHVAVCSSSASATCEGEGSAAQHGRHLCFSPSAPRERAQLIKGEMYVTETTLRGNKFGPKRKVGKSSRRM